MIDKQKQNHNSHCNHRNIFNQVMPRCTQTLKLNVHEITNIHKILTLKTDVMARVGLGAALLSNVYVFCVYNLKLPNDNLFFFC